MLPTYHDGFLFQLSASLYLECHLQGSQKQDVLGNKDFVHWSQLRYLLIFIWREGEVQIFEQTFQYVQTHLLLFHTSQEGNFLPLELCCFLICRELQDSQLPFYIEHHRNLVFF